MKNYKLTTRLKNETWINPEIKPLKRDMNLDQTRQNTHTKKKNHVLKFLTPLMPSVEKIVNLYRFI